MPKHEPTYLICATTAEESRAVEGSVQTNCNKCDAAIWISPSGLNIVRRENAIAICPECAEKQMKENPEDVELKDLNEEQIEEIRKALQNEINPGQQRRFSR